jgi:CoA-transferase family III.
VHAAGQARRAPEIIYGSVVDYYAAALLAAGVSSALYERERSGWASSSACRCCAAR